MPSNDSGLFRDGRPRLCHTAESEVIRARANFSLPTGTAAYAQRAGKQLQTEAE
jgi:hypothetical protein